MTETNVTDESVQKWHAQIYRLKWELEKLAPALIWENIGETETAQDCPLFQQRLLGVRAKNKARTFEATWTVTKTNLDALNLQVLAEHIVSRILEKVSA
jgi:hypothetical protein